MTSGMASGQQVVVVTDSTSYLPAGLADQLGIRVVALQVRLGERTGLEGVDVSPADVTTALRARTAVSTSRPSTAEFVQVYREALDSGAAAVVSLHLSAELSGTCDSARLAAAEFGDARSRPWSAPRRCSTWTRWNGSIAAAGSVPRRPGSVPRCR
jgi:DegV family protein with EDD domain